MAAFTLVAELDVVSGREKHQCIPGLSSAAGRVGVLTEGGAPEKEHVAAGRESRAQF